MASRTAFCVQGPQGRNGMPGKNGPPGRDGMDGMPGRDGEQAVHAYFSCFEAAICFES